MDTQKERTDKLLVKLKVLENRIDQLGLVTNEILNEVNSEYEDQIHQLKKKKETISNQLLEIQKINDMDT